MPLGAFCLSLSSCFASFSAVTPSQPEPILTLLRGMRDSTGAATLPLASLQGCTEGLRGALGCPDLSSHHGVEPGAGAGGSVLPMRVGLPLLWDQPLCSELTLQPFCFGFYSCIFKSRPRPFFHSHLLFNSHLSCWGTLGTCLLVKCFLLQVSVELLGST